MLHPLFPLGHFPIISYCKSVAFSLEINVTEEKFWLTNEWGLKERFRSLEFLSSHWDFLTIWQLIFIMKAFLLIFDQVLLVIMSDVAETLLYVLYNIQFSCEDTNITLFKPRGKRGLKSPILVLAFKLRFSICLIIWFFLLIDIFINKQWNKLWKQWIWLRPPRGVNRAYLHQAYKPCFTRAVPPQTYGNTIT